MNIKRINEKFTTYKKWLKTLLMKEYLDLPYKKQKEFITLIEDFLQKCKKINDEAAVINERVFQIKVNNVSPLKTGDHLITGSVYEEEIKIVLPSTEPRPEKADFMDCIFYSTDEKNWYPSKQDIIKKLKYRNKNKV